MVCGRACVRACAVLSWVMVFRGCCFDASGGMGCWKEDQRGKREIVRGAGGRGGGGLDDTIICRSWCAERVKVLSVCWTRGRVLETCMYLYSCFVLRSMIWHWISTRCAVYELDAQP